VIRPVVLPDDLPALLELETALFGGDNSLGEGLLRRELEIGFGWVIGTPAYAYALVRADGPLIDLTRIGVLPAWQGNGLGPALLEKVLSLGKETMLTVRKDNRRALKIYMAHGFQIVSHHPTDAWVMRRPIQSARAENSAPQAHR
jgi:[ribosomal protein S18]-alanine N-acetyltransferase